MKRATGNENRQKEFKERRENVEKIQEQSQLGKMSAQMWREKSRDRLCQLGRNEFEEKKENAERIKVRKQNLFSLVNWTMPKDFGSFFSRIKGEKCHFSGEFSRI